MARLPDRFDLWVRKARSCEDPARQVDFVLGALIGLKEWNFLPAGPKENPRPAETEIEGVKYILIFSDADRVEDILPPHGEMGDPHRIITMPATSALAWCVERRTGLLVNPGEDAVLIPPAQIEAFHAEWCRRGGRQAAGFWIPNLTTVEEDFWQEHGL